MANKKKSKTPVKQEEKPVEETAATQNESGEDQKIKDYLENLKSKLAGGSEEKTAEPENAGGSEDDQKIKDYLENLKKKLGSSESAAPQQSADGVQTKTVSSMDFNQMVQDYLSKNKVKLYILTPCYGGVCHVNYINKVIETKELLNSLGIKVVLQFIRNESLITRGRNNLIAKSMFDQEMTHCMFIDSDITWEPISILKLIIADKELSGGIYPIKKYHWDRLTPEKMNEILKRKSLPYNSQLTDTQMIYHNLLQYNFNWLPNSNKIENNMMEIYTLATGFMMIKRSCIEKMIAAHPQCKYTDDCGFLKGDENKYAYSLFDCQIVNDHYYSEDWLFCHRWRAIGGQIFVDITIDLWHTGQEDYCGRLISTLNIGG